MLREELPLLLVVVVVVVVVTTRTTANTVTASIANGASANIEITAAKTYALQKIQTDAAAWVTLYVSAAARTADASRNETTDPLPGAGVIAEVITSDGAIQNITPNPGWNDERHQPQMHI